jgi:hypothetical protein
MWITALCFLNGYTFLDNQRITCKRSPLLVKQLDGLISRLALNADVFFFHRGRVKHSFVLRLLYRTASQGKRRSQFSQ